MKIDGNGLPNTLINIFIQMEDMSKLQKFQPLTTKKVYATHEWKKFIKVKWQKYLKKYIN